jgi:hypothetical protein
MYHPILITPMTETEVTRRQVISPTTPTLRIITAQFYETPSHGYLAVATNIIRDLGIADKISGFSGINNGYVYLEEDCDCPMFIDSCKANGIQINLTAHYIGHKFFPTHNYHASKVQI